MSVTYDASGRFFEWLGVLFLALSVWIWRDKLKLTSVGLLGGLPITQQTPDQVRSLESAPLSAEDLGAKIEAREVGDARDFVLSYLRQHSALTDTRLADEMKIPLRKARYILSDLAAQGQLRRDGFPQHTLYTLASSLENRALDYVRDHMIAPQYRLLNERRFVRISGILQVDAVFECEERSFVVEVKYLRSTAWQQALDSGLQQLQLLHKEPSIRQLAGILVLITRDANHVPALTRIVALTSPESGDFPIRVVVLSDDELAEGTSDP